MTDRVTADDERRVRSSLERLSERAPRGFEPPPIMLRRARRRVAATAIATVVALSATVLGGLGLSGALVGNRPDTVATGPQQPAAAPCDFRPLEVGTLPPGLAGLVEAGGTSPRDVWAGGYVTDADRQDSRALMLHWDGSSLSRVQMPEGTPDVNSVAALTPDDAWAATLAGPLHWDGTSWSSLGDPVTRFKGRQVVGTIAASASGPDDVWAVGQNPPASSRDHQTRPFAEHFDGEAWTETPTPEGVQGELMMLWDVAAVAPGDAWAVGGDAQTTGPAAPLVLHFDGDAWSAVDVPAPANGGYVGYAVSASGPNDVWVAADAVFPSFDTTPGILLHYDGSTWSRVSLPSEGDGALHVQSVDAAAPDDVWVAGSAIDTGSRRIAPVVEHFDGTGWTSVPVTGPEAGAQALVRSVSVIGNEVWAVGYSRLARTPDDGNSLPPFVSVCR